MHIFILITKYFYDCTIILQFEEPLFILITFIKPHCIFVLKKLHFGVFMGEMLSLLVILSCQTTFNSFKQKSHFKLNWKSKSLTSTCVLYIFICSNRLHSIIQFTSAIQHKYDVNELDINPADL